ncbi:MAG TPA: hypothetical protein VEA99_03055 [Gemmatimonadaceae bacterium]|nr:hypothetical protein [Gemmatimonadaceae bacterium]
MSRIALVTHRGLPRLSPDDQLLVPALAARGVRAEPAAWDDPDVDWSAFDAAVMRSAWNYHLETERFDAWLRQMETSGVRLWNSPALLRWNADKRYLIELSARGVPIAHTRVAERGSDVGLDALLEKAGWHEAVVKPLVSASAHGTWRVSRPVADEDERRFREQVAERGQIVQRFIPQVVREGEWSLVFFGGAFSHAVLKRPASGDFRVQQEHGGTAERVEPTPDLLNDARAILSRVPEQTLYARVDGCALAGRLMLMELELLEPSVFLKADADAAGRFAEAVCRLALTSG